MNTNLKRKKIAYVTGTRADFGLMTPILETIEKSKSLDLQLFATGIHLMSQFGQTIKEVVRRFPQTIPVVATFKSDDRLGMASFSSKFLSQVIKVFNKFKPDLVLVLGDRAEMLCAAVACLYLGIPVGHIHGGEKTMTVDEVARHAITKLSHIHFAATKEAARRIAHLGEEKWRIHVVGAPALDVIRNEKLPSRNVLFRHLGLDPQKKVILVTQHPVSEEVEKSAEQMRTILKAVKVFNLPVVVIYPNADAGGRKIIAEINKERNNPSFYIFPSLEYRKFLALEREAAVWVGNSSGAIIEAASFKTPVVNIGKRQWGRSGGKNIINVDYDEKEIMTAIRKCLFNRSFLNSLAALQNRWGDGKTTSRVVKILEELDINSKLLFKQIVY